VPKASKSALRSKRVRTTRADPTAARHPDLVQRRFSAEAPNQLWVTDLTYVPTWAGPAHVCFIIDAYSRMIGRWRVAPNMRTDTARSSVGRSPPRSSPSAHSRSTARCCIDRLNSPWD